MNAKQIIERADYLMRVLNGDTEVDEADLGKSDYELYQEWRVEMTDFLAQYDLFVQGKP